MINGLNRSAARVSLNAKKVYLSVRILHYSGHHRKNFHHVRFGDEFHQSAVRVGFDGSGQDSFYQFNNQKKLDVLATLGVVIAHSSPTVRT